MSWRIHTASFTEVQQGSVQSLDEEFGYEHTADEAEHEVTALVDHGNQEIWVVNDVEGLFNQLAEILGPDGKGAPGEPECSHCKNDPPRGHTCPRCGRST